MTEPIRLTVHVELTGDQLEQVAARVADLLAARVPIEPDRWLSAAEAARHLGCPASRIYDLVQLRRLTPARDGRRLAFRRSELDAYLEASAGSPSGTGR